MTHKQTKPQSRRAKLASPVVDVEGAPAAQVPSSSEMLECIECLWGVVEDILPQIGRIVLQDYERLNRGSMLARSILRKTSAASPTALA